MEEIARRKDGPVAAAVRMNRYYLIALAVILLDQIVKFAVKFNMEYGSSIPEEGVFKLHYLENQGAAFGLTITEIFRKIGIEISDETGKLILTLFSIGAVIIIVYFLRQAAKMLSPMPIFVALILGGALGNIIDRVFYGVWFYGMNNYSEGLLHGRVVDMFFVDLGSWNIFGTEMELWPVFNVADAAISVGIVTILIFQGKFIKIHKRNMERLSPPSAQENAAPESSAAADTPAT